MRSHPVLLAALLAIASQAHGAPQGLGGKLPVSELSAARLSRSVGDGVLKGLLEADEPGRRDLLAALRAAPHASAPELLVPALCRWAASRDPHLAPAAARALFQLADSLDPRDLAAREVALGSVRAARAALTELMAHEPAARADIVFAAGYADAAFAQLLGQLGEG